GDQLERDVRGAVAGRCMGPAHVSTGRPGQLGGVLEKAPPPTSHAVPRHPSSQGDARGGLKGPPFELTWGVTWILAWVLTWVRWDRGLWARQAHGVFHQAWLQSPSQLGPTERALWVRWAPGRCPLCWVPPGYAPAASPLAPWRTRRRK